jgi:hypothetical protein
MPSQVDTSQVLVPQAVVVGTLQVLRDFGKRRCEGLVLWVGRVIAKTATVEDIIVPPQRAVENEEGIGYFVEPGALFKLNQALSESKQQLIAQVHSHPGRAFHSDADDRYAIVTAEGGFSLVVPNFGDAPADLNKWAIYRLIDSTWTELDGAEARRLFRSSQEDFA